MSLTLAETVRAMADAGCSAQQIVAVVARLEEERISKTRRDVSPGEWYALRSTVLERDGFACVYCGSAASEEFPLHCDHVLPRSRGGKSTLDNLVAACINCNCSKRDRTPSEWGRECP